MRVTPRSSEPRAETVSTRPEKREPSKGLDRVTVGAVVSAGVGVGVGVSAGGGVGVAVGLPPVLVKKGELNSVLRSGAAARSSRPSLGKFHQAHMTVC